VKGTDTIAFIFTSEVTRDITVTYGILVCDIRPQKAEQHRLQLTIGGNHIDYPREMATKNADLTTSKCLSNSIISTDNAMYMCADVKKIYLNTMLNRPEYMRLALTIIPHEIINKYNWIEKRKKWARIYPYRQRYVWTTTSRQACQ
jgi:hypothetical protein